MANESKMADEPKIEELDKLIAKGKQKGFLTYDEVNDALPSDLVTLDQLDDIMMMFGSMDIELVDSTKAARLPSEMAVPGRRPEPTTRSGAAPHRSHARTGGTHRGDPVRLYLREMGRVLSLPRARADHVAKRIEEGKDEATRASSRPPSPSTRSAPCATSSAKAPIKDVSTSEEESPRRRERLGAR
jgi:RNA polymerase primary sigma factor